MQEEGKTCSQYSGGSGMEQDCEEIYCSHLIVLAVHFFLIIIIAVVFTLPLIHRAL